MDTPSDDGIGLWPHVVFAIFAGLTSIAFTLIFFFGFKKFPPYGGPQAFTAIVNGLASALNIYAILQIRKRRKQRMIDDLLKDRAHDLDLGDWL